MTLTTNPTSGQFVADGLGTPRTLEFQLRRPADLIVEADGVVQIQGTHYAVSGIYPAQQIVPIAPYWVNGAVIAYRRSTARGQDYRIPSGEDLRAASLEDELDRTQMQQQEQDDDIARAPKFARGATVYDFGAITAGQALGVVGGQIVGFDNDPALAADSAAQASTALGLVLAAKAAIDATAEEVAGTKDEIAAVRAEVLSAAAAALLAGGIYSDTAAGIAATSDGEGFWVKGNGLAYYLNDSDVAVDQGVTLIDQSLLSVLLGNLGEYTGFPGIRNRYGIIGGIVPHGMTASEAVLGVDQIVTITAGAGNDLRFDSSGRVTALVPGEEFFCFVEPKDGNFNSATSTVTLGTTTYNFEERGRFWVVEKTIPAGATSFKLDLDTNGSQAKLPVSWAVGPAGASGEFAQPDAERLPGCFLNGGEAHASNLWSLGPFTVNSGDSSETQRASGLSLPVGGTAVALVRCLDANGDPAVFSRAFFRAQGSIGTEFQTFPCTPIRGQLGWYYARLKMNPATVTTPTVYVELTIDNAIPGSFAPQTDITVQVQMYAGALPDFAPTASGGESAAIITNPMPGLLLVPSASQKNVFLPGGAPQSARGFSFPLQKFTGLADGAGGTTSDCWNFTGAYDARRTQELACTTVAEATLISGQTGCAIFTAIDGNIVGFDDHNRCHIDAPPVIRIDGDEVADASTDPVAGKQLDILTSHTLTDFLGVANIFNVRALYRFDAETRTLDEIWYMKALSAVTTYAAHVGMWPWLSTLFSSVRHPGRGMQDQLVTGHGDPYYLAYPAVSLVGPSGLQIDHRIIDAYDMDQVEVGVSNPASPQKKIYPNLHPLANQFRNTPRPGPVTWAIGEERWAHFRTTFSNGNA
tara:strand:+ start:924 stop:3524 length:2601 start_codon:yes stop_codon:yes gene_type:complete